MAHVIITLKIMPDSPEANLDELFEKSKTIIEKNQGIIKENSLEPVAFGLKAVIVRFSKDESTGSTDELEDEISELGEVNSVSVIAVGRAMG